MNDLDGREYPSAVHDSYAEFIGGVYRILRSIPGAGGPCLSQNALEQDGICQTVDPVANKKLAADPEYRPPNLAQARRLDVSYNVAFLDEGSLTSRIRSGPETQSSKLTSYDAREVIMWTAFFNVVIGLMTVFLLFSILVSGVNESFAQYFSRRGYYLRICLQRLFNDDAVYRRVLHHPLIGSLYQKRAAQEKPPSYIDPENLAMAVADVLLARAGTKRAPTGAAAQLTVQALRGALQGPALVASPIAAALGPIIDRAANNLEAALRGIQGWFNATTDRVSGWYKTRIRKVLFVVGLALAALCNVDAIEIAATLNRSPALRASLFDIAKSAIAGQGWRCEHCKL